MKLPVIIILLLAISFTGCESEEDNTIVLNKNESYSLDLNVYGDEESAQILQQAQNYLQSEIIRDSSTNWGATYLYKPALDYIGTDIVVIETCTGGKGVSCDEIKLIELNFLIKN